MHATSSETRHTFKQGIHLHDDHLILPHHMPFIVDAFNPVYILPTKFENAINTTIVRLLQNFHTTTMDTADYWLMAQEVFHLECCYCFITVLDRGP